MNAVTGRCEILSPTENNSDISGKGNRRQMQPIKTCRNQSNPLQRKYGEVKPKRARWPSPDNNENNDTKKDINNSVSAISQMGNNGFF